MKPQALPPQAVLETPRLRLTPLALADAPAVYAYASDPEVARYVTWRPHASLADAEAFVRAAGAEPSTHVWALRASGGPGAPPGGWSLDQAPLMGVFEFSAEAPELGSVHYVLARPVWGRGLATEAVRAVLAWAFDALPGLRAVQTTAAEANVGSRRVLEKCGFRAAGVEDARWAKYAEPVRLCVYRRERGGTDGIVRQPG
jgi:ribosomal-protein-alanine N-acetyltransferase